MFKVNVNKPETILKKLVRAEKKKALKRTHKQMEQMQEESDEAAAPIKRSVDKAALQKSIDDRDYNMALHFAKKLTVPLEPSSKARAFTVYKKSSSSKVDVIVSFHGNSLALYSIETEKDEETKEAQFQVKQTYGQMECHKQPVRGVCVSANDQVFATNSFDSVKVWTVDLFMYSQRNNL